MDAPTAHLVIEALDGADRGRRLTYAVPASIVLGRSGTPDLELQHLADPSLLESHLLVTVSPRGEIAVDCLGPTGSATVSGKPFDRQSVPSGALVRAGDVTLRLSVARQDVLVGAVPRARLSRYRILEEIGQGAFSRVYAAVERKTGRQVALKRLRLGDTPARDTLISAFLREIQTAASLEHPGVAQVLAAGRRGDDLFLVMEFVDGPDLDACIALQGALSAGVVRHIGAGMLEALDHAHARGVIHRDVKPSNVMLRGEGPRPDVVLVDFGLAVERACQQAWGLTVTGDFRGTPAFTAPECLLDARRHSERADLFGVGATLYFALTAKACRVGSASVEALARSDVVPLAEARPDLAHTLAPVVDRALQIDPERRWATAGDMLAALASAEA